MTDRSVHTSATLRRRVDYVLGWVAIVGGSTAAIAAMIWSPSTGTFVDPLEGTLLIDVLLWFIWVVMHAHVVVADWGIRVVNWFVKCDIPWAAIDDVQAREDVRILLRNGRTMRPVIGSYSLVSAVAGGAVQKRIADALVAARALDAEKAPAAVRWRPDLHLRFLLLATVSLVGLNAIIYFYILMW